MFSNFLIGLREGLEASLVVGILVAYLVSTGRRAELPAVWTGVTTAIVISIGFSALLTFGPRGLTFEAQEAIGGGLSLVAVGFLTWMIFWMQRFSRYLKSELHTRVDGTQNERGSLLVVVAALAVGREGLETSLFLWSAARATGSTWDPIVGGLLGITVAVVMGVLTYTGALRINLRRFFNWTGVGLIVIAAGVLSYGTHDLQEAGILPGLNSLAFDVSDIIRPDSTLGTLLKGTINFSPTTTWFELGAWLVYIIPVAYFFNFNSHKELNRSEYHHK